MRLESYLFTLEAAETARDRLAPGGVFAMYNYFREDWLVERYANTLYQAFDTRPCVTRFGGANLSVLIASEDPVGDLLPAVGGARSRGCGPSRSAADAPAAEVEAAAARPPSRPPTTTRSRTSASGRSPASTWAAGR